MKCTTRAVAVLAGAAVIGGLTFGASAADAGTIVAPTPTIPVWHPLAMPTATGRFAPTTSSSTSSGYGTSSGYSSSSSSSKGGTIPTLTSSAQKLVAAIETGIKTPCQFDASEPGSLIIFGDQARIPYVIEYSVRGVPVELKSGSLGTYGTVMKAVPSDWNNGNVRVWVAGTRCTTT